MSRFRSSLALLGALTIMLGSFVSLTAQEATPAAGGVTILAPDESYAGATLGEWNARWFQWALSFPPEVNPNTTAGEATCSYGQHGPVFFLPANFGPPGPTVTCVVPEGVAIFLNLGGVDCSTVEPPPFFGRDEDELRSCAATLAEDIPIADQTVSINGQEVPDLASYRSTSPLTPIVFPQGNVFDAPAGAASFVNEMYGFLIAPPAPGDYEIVLTAGPDVILTYQLTVQAPQIIEPAATPGASPEVATPAG